MLHLPPTTQLPSQPSHGAMVLTDGPGSKADDPNPPRSWRQPPCFELSAHRRRFTYFPYLIPILKTVLLFRFNYSLFRGEGRHMRASLWAREPVLFPRGSALLFPSPSNVTGSSGRLARAEETRMKHVHRDDSRLWLKCSPLPCRGNCDRENYQRTHESLMIEVQKKCFYDAEKQRQPPVLSLKHPFPIHVHVTW